MRGDRGVFVLILEEGRVGGEKRRRREGRVGVEMRRGGNGKREGVLMAS